MAQQGQQQPGDNSMAPVWIIIFLFCALYFVWWSAHQYIVSAVFFVNIIQAKLVALVMGEGVLSEHIFLMQTLDPKMVDWDSLILLTQAVGEYTRYPVVGILSLLAVFLYKSNSTLRFRKTYNMKMLRAQEQYNWPAIMPVVKENLATVDINQGPWAMALTPMEFARKHNLLKKGDASLESRMPGLEMTASLRRSDAKRIFTLQLGAAWNGFEACPPHTRALAAVFMARINRDRDSADKILRALDKGYAHGKMDYSAATSVLNKYKNTPIVQETLLKHAYVLTVMASLLLAARADGVVPSAEFLWLKPVDRRLWYMLNCVGRQTPYAEVAGAFAHWRAEQAMQARLLVPMVDEATTALEVAIKEVKLSFRELQELEP